MTVVVSIHDATPYHIRSIESIISRLGNLPLSILVTPFWEGRHKLNWDLVRLIENYDTVLHGYTHQGGQDRYSQWLFRNKDLSREFRGINREKTMEKIHWGMKEYENYLGKKPLGFIPPMWYHNSYTIDILNELDFDYTEGWTAWINLKTGQKRHGLPLSFDYGDNMILSRICLWHARLTINRIRPSFIRFAIHPQDVQHGFLDAICDRIDMLQDRGYHFTTYQHLAKAS